MALTQKGKYHYGDNSDDLHELIRSYSVANEYSVDHLVDAVCQCGGHLFGLMIDDGTAAVRVCRACESEHPIGDSEEYLEDADLEECACPCGKETFEIAVGVHLYRGSEDVKWLYIGCRCPSCRLTAIYGDWKNECPDYKQFLARV